MSPFAFAAVSAGYFSLPSRGQCLSNPTPASVLRDTLSLVRYYMYYITSTLRFTHFTFSGNFILVLGTQILLCTVFVIIYGHFGIYISHVRSLLLGFLTVVKNVECDAVETKKIFRVGLKDKK